MLQQENSKLISSKKCLNTNSFLEEIASRKQDLKQKKRYWELEENKKYVEFLSQNMKTMAKESNRRFQRIFLQMSYNISTKTAQQCRTHHQKALLKYGNLEKIVRCMVPDLEKKEQKRQLQIVAQEVIKKNEFYQMRRLNDSSLKISINLDSLVNW